jgi:hypothetical protein
MKAKAKGQLRHRFRGEYSAVIALAFDSDYECKEALKRLGESWKPANSPKALVWAGNFDQLETCKALLGSFGADVKKIDSMRKSVDYGEPFEIEVELA